MINKNLLIIGAGGHGKSVADAARNMGTWEKISFLDDNYPSVLQNGIWPVIGKTSALPELIAQYKFVAIGIGNNQVRLMFLERLKQLNCALPVIQDPTAIVSQFSIIGEGTVLLAGSIVAIDTHIGSGVIINKAVTIGHDCYIHNGVHICPNAALAGSVQVEKASWVGIGSNVIQGIHIGENAIVGAGSVVIRDVPDNAIVAGVPAKRIDTNQ